MGSGLRAWPLVFLATALLGQDADRADADRPVKSEDAAEKKTLEEWTFEPVALDRSTFSVRVDRRDSSFSYQVARSGAKFYSPAHRRGFASVVLADGREIPVDRVEGLDARDERIRFRAASTQGELPRIWLEFRELERQNGLAIGYKVDESEREKVRAVRLLDDGFWLDSPDEDGALLALGTGEWLTPDGGPREILLGNVPKVVDAPSDGLRQNLPAIGLRRRSGLLLLYWDDPSLRIAVRRRVAESGFLAGKSALSLSVESSSPTGEIRLIASSEASLEQAEIARELRAAVSSMSRVDSLRFKTGQSDLQRSIVGAALFPLRMTEPAPPLAVRGKARFRFDDVDRIAERLQSKLEIDQALFLLDDWIGSGLDSESATWLAAPECGGNEGLSRLGASIRKRQYLLGLGVRLDHLVKPSAKTGTSEGQWSAALEFARDRDGFSALEDLCDPELLVVRDHAPSLPTMTEPAVIANPRDAVGKRALEVFGLWARSPASVDSVRTSVLADHVLDRKLLEPTSPSVYPFFPAAFGDSVRFVARPDLALGPDDAKGFLAHLILGQAPSYQLPPEKYLEGDDVALGDTADWCFAREGGWTAGRGLTPREVFIKNTFEVASWLARIGVRTRLTSHRFLTEDGSVQESYFGPDLRVLVNFGEQGYEDEETDTVLPQHGFLIRHPFLRAFYALKAGGLSYDEPSFFLVRSLEGKLLLRAEKVLMYRGFGSKQIRLGGKVFEVETELITKIW